MYLRSNRLAALAAVAMLSTGSPALAQADYYADAPAVRAGESIEGGSALEGGAWIAPVLASLIILGGVLLAAGVFDEDNPPTSP